MQSTNKEQRDESAPEAFPGDRILDDLRSALSFYSRLSTGAVGHRPPDLDRIALLLPLVSLLIGLLPATVLIASAALTLPPLVGAGLAVLALVLLTGAMAEDALADAADGLAGGATAEQRLEIMKDSRHGTYGVCALCLLLLLRVAVLGTSPNVLAAAGAWMAATVLARSGALCLPLALPPARSSGLSAGAGRVSSLAFLVGAGFAALVALVFAVPSAGLVSFVAALGVAALMSLLWVALCRRLVGGQSGDLIGALQALIEICTLVVFCAFL